jgi:FtsZ-binding cell division protein ZapB
MDSAFDQLEEKVKKAAEALRRLRQENRTLQEEAERLKKGAAAASDTRKVDALQEEIQGLRAEREEIRRRIAKLVQVLDAFDTQE